MLRGSLDDFTLPDILRLLSSAKKTGVLAVSSRGGRGRVYFRGGDVYYAEENGDPRSVGQRLVDSGVVTGDEVDDALALSERTGRSVGEILISDTGTTLDRLQQAVIDQINDACFDLMRWGQGDFIWQHGQGIRPEVDASISVDEIIIEAARRLDAIANQEPQSLPEAAVPALSPAFASAAAPITISPDQWRILAFLDGRRTAAEVAALAGGDTADALRDLHHLTSAGVVELVESSPKVRPPSPPVVPQAPTDAAPHDAAPREAAPSDPNPAPREEPPLPVHPPLQVVPQEAVEALEEEAPPEPAPPLKEDFAAFQEVAIASAHESVGDGAETATTPPSPPVEDFDAPGDGE
ncbi:MAG: hypothetical protein QOH90_1968, partial [Actinomycetota bacterium]|nr:hypothetical protein [Actinomycetota bacterium]